MNVDRQYNTADENASAGGEQHQDVTAGMHWYQAIVQSLPRYQQHILVDVAAPTKPIQHFSEFTLEGGVFRKCMDQSFAIKGSRIDAVSDLIPGVYGGGLKIWECTMDLMLYMWKYKHLLPPSTDNCRVLELGCGHGFPGIAAMMLGYHHVVFSDLNLEVIQACTWPNIVLNCPDYAQTQVSCIAGDWLALANRLQSSGEKFKLIVSAETLYSVETCQHVAYFLHNFLDEDGLAIIATKRFYFGVGGGTSEFENLMLALGKFQTQVVQAFEDGNSNIRDIILVKKHFS